ncbi:putative phage abortive infection protein [Methylobacter tundripaludum]|uniref:Putative phage abortive infection protein n=1 Tax=Methylobacter tundripaludum TaxID=173365 RepID=A0A2S6H2X0_9GAMM|nr:putative phage abortive infection protein [Methylobacter tundripaludum]PPK71756.1 putative phage abortive infection protein [Methylobacter tundripaludum]
MSNKEPDKKTESAVPKKSTNILLWIVVVIASLVVAIVFWNYFSHFNDSPFSGKADAGQFGDYIGGTLNPILSFLSLIALLWTIGIQTKELELTRNELDLTRKELSRSASAQEDTKKILDKQSETLARQQFESTFFSLLDQHNKALEAISTSPDVTRYSHVKLIYRSIFLESDFTNLASAKVALEKKNNVCGHYFRVLYQLLKFIAINAPGSTIGAALEADKIQSSDVLANEKMYSNIVRSFLGYDITQLLAINCYCTDANDTYWKYKLLIERYAFLEHMPFEVNNGGHPILNETKNAYEKNAFGNSEFITR